MGTEIERKFMVNEATLFATSIGETIKQGYIQTASYSKDPQVINRRIRVLYPDLKALEKFWSKPVEKPKFVVGVRNPRINPLGFEFRVDDNVMSVGYQLLTDEAKDIVDLFPTEKDFVGYIEEQTYLKTDSKFVVRIRVKGKQGYITFKGPSSGATRAEFEFPIQLRYAETLLTYMTPGYLSKTRHVHMYEGFKWEVDFFQNPPGLILAEIELPSETTEFKRPDWIGREVTDDIEYTNSRILEKMLCKTT